MPPVVYIALGANLGDPLAQVHAAIRRLGDISAVPLRSSSLWQSTPDGCPPGSPHFVNAVVALVPAAGETPESMLVRLQALEREFGRKPKSVPNEARPLDLDLIAWGDEHRHSPELILPHPRAHQRRFVLEPLAELAPELVLPGHDQSVRKLLKDALPDPALRRLASAGDVSAQDGTMPLRNRSSALIDANKSSV